MYFITFLLTEKNDLISRWDFEGSTVDPNGKTRIIDLGPGKNDGFLEGNAHLSSGRFGKALSLTVMGIFSVCQNFVVVTTHETLLSQRGSNF